VADGPGYRAEGKDLFVTVDDMVRVCVCVCVCLRVCVYVCVCVCVCVSM
jgi:hypothetical protein